MPELTDLLEPYRIAFEAAPIGMSFISADWRLLACNPALCRMLGRTEDELRARSASEVTHPDDRHLHVPNHQRLLAGEIDSYEFEARYLRADESIGWGAVHMGVLRGVRGQPEMVITLVEDVTERRWMREVHDRLLGLVLVGQGAAALAEALADLIESPVALLDGYGQVIAASDHSGRMLDVPSRAQLEQHDSAAEQLTIRPLELGDQIEGYLVAEDRPGATHLTARAIEQAASTFALQLAMTRNAENIEHRLHADLFDAILSDTPPDPASLHRLARRLGHDLAVFTRIALVRPSESFDATTIARITRATSMLTTELASGSLVVPRGDGTLIALTIDAGAEPRRLGRTLVERLQAQIRIPVVIGISGGITTPAGIAGAVHDARRAVDVAIAAPALGPVSLASELDLRHLLLLGRLASDEVVAAARRTLRPLTQANGIRRPERLLRTLEAYLEQLGNLEATARQLNIHINTLRQRIDRIEATLGLDLRDSRTRVNLQLALDALEMAEAPDRPPAAVTVSRGR